MNNSGTFGERARARVPQLHRIMDALSGTDVLINLINL